MSVDIAKLIDNVISAFNLHDVEKFMSYYAPDARHFQPTQPEPFKGREAIKEDYMNATFTPFPDVQIEKKRVFYQGNWVCFEGILRGTNKGPIKSEQETIPPTGKKIEVPFCFVVKLRGGLMIEVHEYTDQLGYLKQIGLG